MQELKVLLAAAVLLLPFLQGGEAKIARTYYIQAEKILWNYTAGTDINACQNTEYTEEENVFVKHTEGTIGSSFYKAVYREYTDNTFQTRKVRNEWAHLGILGPVIRGVEGEQVKIVFRNKLDFDVNLRCNSAIVSSVDPPGSNIPVTPNSVTNYVWTFTSASAPAAGDDSSTMYVYRSFIDSTAHDYSGLVGPILVTKAGKARSGSAVPTDVDREFVQMFSVINEGASVFLQDNIDKYLNGTTPSDADTFDESNLKHAINGLLYCYQSNLLTMRIGERVRWYVMDIGSEVDLHTPHWHGNVVTVRKQNRDEFKMEPGSVVVANMKADSVGTWLFHCHVNDHISAGMITSFTVTGASKTPTTTRGTTVNYYIAAEEVMWNFLPDGKSSCLSAQVLDEPASPFENLTQTYKKALYICYTDSSFTRKCPGTAATEHLGMLGPVLRANVGDTIQVNFYNKLTHPVSLHPHGVFYNKTSEGAPYFDNRASMAGSAVEPGQKHTYRWFVRDEAGPGPHDGNTILWMYHSHTDEIADTNAGV